MAYKTKSRYKDNYDCSCGGHFDLTDKYEHNGLLYLKYQCCVCEKAEPTVIVLDSKWYFKPTTVRGMRSDLKLKKF